MVNRPMSEKASGNGAKKRDPRNSQDDLSGPEGKEISLDPESGQSTLFEIHVAKVIIFFISDVVK